MAFTLTFPDGSIRVYDAPLSGLDVAKSLSNSLARSALAVMADGQVRDLSSMIDADAKIRILTFEDPEGKQVFWHSSAHILAQAVVELYPSALLTIGPAIENGFYYDIDMPPVGEEEMRRLEERMRDIVKQDLRFERHELSKGDAIARFNDNPYKLELIEEYDDLSIYSQGAFTDLCRGPHIPSTGMVKAVKLTMTSGAFWRADESRKQLVRIYGISFPKQSMLDEHIEALEKAKERDHRRIGKEMDLFTFSDLVGSGLPLFTPKGTVIRTELQDALIEFSKDFAVQPVTIPHIAKIDLYKVSGHAEKFGDELFKVISHHGQEFVMKPVNCPHHTQIYASQKRSYRDLPLRYMESTMQYRDERPGELGGLVRVRSITVDDGHTFCTMDQVKDESKAIAVIIERMYSSLGMYGSHWVSLSVRDPARPDAYIGEDEDWARAERMLQEVSDELGLDARRMEGEAALYGPKLDFMFKDSLGRERQLSTIQLDFAMPKRFGLTYADSDGSEKTPVMIHRAILGSYERFMAVLIEHFAGKFPLWLAPVQGVVIPISDQHIDYARSVVDAFSGLRIELDARSESVSYKVRDAQLKRVPYMFVVGGKEAEAGTVTVRTRDNEVLGAFSLASVVSGVKEAYRSRQIPIRREFS